MNTELIVIAVIALIQNGLVFAEDTKSPVIQPLSNGMLFDLLKGVCIPSLSQYGLLHAEYQQFKLAADNYMVKLFNNAKYSDQYRLDDLKKAHDYLRETVNEYGKKLTAEQLEVFKREMIEIQAVKSKSGIDGCNELTKDNFKF